MTITTVDQLAISMNAASQQRFIINKISSIPGVPAAGSQGSYWLSTTIPLAGSIPTTAATCNNTTTGGLLYRTPISGSATYIAKISASCSSAGGIEVHDRLAHMGGLVGNITTTQTVGIDLSTMTGDNMAVRTLSSDYSKVEWFLEWYSTTGTSAGSVTVNYTNQSGTAKSNTVTTPASAAAGLLMPIMPLAGDSIRGVVSVIFSTALLTAGNFGVTATVEKTSIPIVLVNRLMEYDWVALGLPPIADSSCLFFVGDSTTTSLGTISGMVILAQG